MFLLFFYVFFVFFIVVFLLLLRHRPKHTKYKYDALLFGKLRLALFLVCNIITVT